MNVAAVSCDQRPDGWSDGAAAYDEWFAPASSRFAINALRLLGLGPGQRLLDVAAGTGALTLQAAEAGLNVLAVDFARGMVRLLRQRLSAAGLHARVEQMDGQALGCGNASFDAACSIFGLIFFPDLDAGARELRRVVHPGGQVLIAAWDRSGFPLPVAVERALQAVTPGLARPAEPPPALRVADPCSVEALLARAGLREVTVLEVTHDWVIPDPAALFRSLPRWAAPLRPVFDALPPSRCDQAAAAFAGIVAGMSQPAGGLPMTALFGHGLR
jgi:SAM-dependent methyltransferase